MAREPLRINGYLAFAIGIFLTIWTCMLVVDSQDAQIRSNFVRDTDKVAADTSARLRTYFDTLLSLKALFSVNGEVDRDQFNQFVRELRLAERYPGFRAVQFVRFVPAGALDAYAAQVRRQSAGQPAMPPFAIHPQPPAAAQGEHSIIEVNEPMAARCCSTAARKARASWRSGCCKTMSTSPSAAGSCATARWPAAATAATSPRPCWSDWAAW